MLAGVPDAMGSAQVQRVLEPPVDGLGVAPPAVDPIEVRIAGRDGPHVLGPVELASGVLVVVVEAHRDGLATVALGKLVIVVPPVETRPVLLARRTDPAKLDEVQLPPVRQLTDPDGAPTGIESD